MEEFKKIKAKTMLLLMSRGKEIKNSPIPEIPKNWEKFANTEDLWCRIDFPEEENISACLYKAKAGSIFPPHVHKNSIEHFVILNKEGSLTLVTNDDITYMKAGDSVVLPKNKEHAVKFNTETTILVMWHPKMNKNFEIDFSEKKEIKSIIKNNNNENSI